MRSIPSHAMITVGNLNDDGVDRAERRHYLRDWHRLERGVYVRTIPDNPEDAHLLRARAALRRHGSGAVLSHQTAALVWELPVFGTALERVRLSRIGTLSTPEMRHPTVIMSGSILPRRDVVVHQGVPVTAAVRTVLDCARLLPLRGGVAIADAAAAAGLLRDREVRRVLAQMKGWKGVGRARTVLSLLDPAAESPGESAARVTMNQLGFRTKSQFEIRDESGFIARVDFLIVGTRVVVEFDGHAKYGSDATENHEQFWKEKRRHDAIVAAGYEVVRLTWPDLNEPTTVHRLLDRAIERSDRRHGR